MIRNDKNLLFTNEICHSEKKQMQKKFQEIYG